MSKFIKSQAQIEREQRPITDYMKEKLLSYGYDPQFEELTIGDYEKIIFMVETKLLPSENKIKFINEVIATEQPDIYKRYWIDIKDKNLFFANKICSIYNYHKNKNNSLSKASNIANKILSNLK